jgi:hypothetical protein
VDGRILLEIDEPFAREALLINHALKRRKLLSCIGKLKLRKKKNLEVIINLISMYCNVEGERERERKRERERERGGGGWS